MEQRLYLLPWDINVARVLDALRTLVLSRGGLIVGYADNEYILSNRTSGDDEVYRTKCRSWLGFVMEDVEYYIDYPDNPLFDGHFSKVHVQVDREKGEIVSRGSYYADHPSIGWASNAAYQRNLTSAEVTCAAEWLLSWCLEQQFSHYAAEIQRVRVPNVMDGGTHIEKVDVGANKKRTKKILEG